MLQMPPILIPPVDPARDARLAAAFADRDSQAVLVLLALSALVALVGLVRAVRRVRRIAG